MPFWKQWALSLCNSSRLRNAPVVEAYVLIIGGMARGPNPGAPLAESVRRIYFVG
jgi:hypothetical protein